MLFPGSNLVLLQTSFKYQLAKLICENPESKLNIINAIKELEGFSKDLNVVEKNIEGLRRFIEKRELKISRYFPVPYNDNGFDRANSLFFYLEKQDVNGFWIVGIDLFFPHLFLQESLNEELKYCSFRKKFKCSNDVRFCEIYNITYYKTLIS